MFADDLALLALAGRVDALEEKITRLELKLNQLQRDVMDERNPDRNDVEQATAAPGELR